jgi:hypothetical protein
MDVAELKKLCRQRIEFQADAIAVFCLRWVAPVAYMLS